MSTIRTNTLLAADGSTTTEPSIPALDQRMAKAWVNFTTSGTLAIRDSYNVSSIVDSGSNVYINFSSPMTDSNFVAFVSSEQGSTNSGNEVGEFSTGGFRTWWSIAETGTDAATVSAIVFGN